LHVRNKNTPHKKEGQIYVTGLALLNRHITTSLKTRAMPKKNRTS
jgi:hypothetical protein